MSSSVRSAASLLHARSSPSTSSPSTPPALGAGEGRPGELSGLTFFLLQQTASHRLRISDDVPAARLAEALMHPMPQMAEADTAVLATAGMAAEQPRDTIRLVVQVISSMDQVCASLTT